MQSWLSKSNPTTHLGWLTASLVLATLILPVAAIAQVEPDVTPWRTEDLIDERIDVDAQYALMRMFDGDLFEATDASGMLSAVKAELLSGIYQVDRKVPALRARSLGTDWWRVIPNDVDAICWREPGDLAPMIIYRKGLGTYRERYDFALRVAWSNCGIPPSFPRPYIQTIQKPPPTPIPPDQPLPPMPAAMLTVMVFADNIPLPGAEVGVEHGESGDSGTAITNGGGVASFNPDPGLVSVWVYGPTDSKGLPVYEPAFRQIEIRSGTSQVLVIDLKRVPRPPDQPPEDVCDTDKYHEVFNSCGRGVLGEAIKCLQGAYGDYAKCKRNPACVAKALGKFLLCRKKLNHKEKIQECTDKANAASGCDFPGPQK